MASTALETAMKNACLGVPVKVALPVAGPGHGAKFFRSRIDHARDPRGQPQAIEHIALRDVSGHLRRGEPR
jgi:hypothetical protein